MAVPAEDMRKFAEVNWLDVLLLVLTAAAAVKAFLRGFLVEACALLGLVAGVWVAVHFSGEVGEAMGLGTEGEAIAFVITLVVVVVLVHLLGRVLTRAIDAARLGLPNKLAGGLFGALRSAFVLSVLLNLLAGWSHGAMPSPEVRGASALYGPVRAFAPFVLPSLGGTDWLLDAVRRLEEQGTDLLDEQPRH
jgi:membrane protein required for colicin V production